MQNQHKRSALKFGSLQPYPVTTGIWAAKPECIHCGRHHQLDIQHGLTQKKHQSLILYFAPGKFFGVKTNCHVNSQYNFDISYRQMATTHKQQLHLNSSERQYQSSQLVLGKQIHRQRHA